MKTRTRITSIEIKGANGIGGTINTEAAAFHLGETDPQHLVLGFFNIAMFAYGRNEAVDIEQNNGKLSSIAISAQKA